MFITLSIFSIPTILSCLPGNSDELYSSFDKALYNISLINVLFPEPDTPVTQVKTPSGIFTLIFFKLFWQAPFISIDFPFDFLRLLGTLICLLPLKYAPVIEFGFCFISSAVPVAITFPP